VLLLPRVRQVGTRASEALLNRVLVAALFVLLAESLYLAWSLNQHATRTHDAMQAVGTALDARRKLIEEYAEKQAALLAEQVAACDRIIALEAELREAERAEALLRAQAAAPDAGAPRRPPASPHAPPAPPAPAEPTEVWVQ